MEEHSHEGRPGIDERWSVSACNCTAARWMRSDWVLLLGVLLGCLTLYTMVSRGGLGDRGSIGFAVVPLAVWLSAQPLKTWLAEGRSRSPRFWVGLGAFLFLLSLIVTHFVYDLRSEAAQRNAERAEHNPTFLADPDD